MTDQPANPSAFPQGNNNYGGMELRDFFAAAALTGLIGFAQEREWEPSELAETVYEYADAMLRGRGE
jgi:hypothetical protein